jgi:exonuclease SbcC
VRPARLELEGFGAFRERTVVDFADAELIALVGRTGSGKSTLIDAITFALFGCVARYDDKKVVAPVINQTSTRARVQLDFELADRTYTVARLVQRTKSGASTREARLEHDGVVLAADAKSVTAEIEQLLGLDADQFNRTVVLPQGRFADFLHDNPRDRQATLRNLLGLGIYQAIASAARRRAAIDKTAADALRPDVDAGRTRLTDARRAELVRRRDDVAAARASFITALDELAAARTSVDELAGRLGELDGHIALLDGLVAPDGLGELDRRRTAAAEALAAATTAVAAARDRRRAADEALATGPDPATAVAQREAHRAAAAAASDHARTAAQLDAARTAAQAARSAADEVLRRQAELDAAATAARAGAAAAQDAAHDVGTVTELEHLLTLHERAAELSTTVAATAAAVEDAARLVDERRRAVETADAAEAEARTRHEHTRERAGAAGFVALLRVGDPCPLCLQEVATLPRHHVDEELARTAEHLQVAATEVAACRTALVQAERDATTLEAHLAADRRTLDALAKDLAGAPDVATLRKRVLAVRQAHEALTLARAAARDAEAAAQAHRDDPEHAAAIQRARAAEDELTSLVALERAERARRDETARAIEGLPDAAAIERAIEEASRLAAAQADASAALARAEDAFEHAAAEQRSTETATRDATNAARAARDRVAVLAPPPLAGDGPAAAWHALLAWATERREQLDAERRTASCDHRAASELAATLEQAARDVVRAVGEPADGPLDSLRDDLARAHASAAAAITTFDDERTRLDALSARVDEHDERAEVAGQLALHLRTDRFEAWLMEAALTELVEAASVRLRELTGGQFSLALVDQAFMVRDHANADELRGARTLSGGETFLASLSLALALADATAELAPEGAPALESIFLDEGFGSLDPSTLETVAGAIEELGSAGRMVVVVTHIHELADRLPVRFEVTKTAATASVERVEG